MLRVPAHPVDRPRFPVIDAHNHLGSPFAGDWPERSPAELEAVLDESGIEAIVDLDGGQGDALSARDRPLADARTGARRRVLRARLRDVGLRSVIR